jgi:2,3-bisphosphoglycerate-independent phosphoglycerate mutase
MLIMPDHATQCATRKHHDAPVPFAIAGTGISNVFERAYTEKDAVNSDLHIQHGHDLMEFFLHANTSARKKV